jgi:hypothetical protein
MCRSLLMLPLALRPNHAHRPVPRRFTSREEVEILARAMRQWDDDEVVLESAADLGERILKVRGWPASCVAA